VHKGDVIADRYRIERLLVRRGTHQVHEATDLAHEAPVAVKVSTPSTAYYELSDQIQRAVRLGRELERASAGIVRPLDGGEVGDSLYLVMDYIHMAEDLDLAADGVDERLVRLRRAALLVRELHALRVVHRDVRPDSFLISGSGRVHLTNFGLGRSLDDRLDDADVGRSVLALAQEHGYLAPEVLDNGTLDVASDVYSLGVMLFELLTGERPYRGTPDDVIAAHKEVLDGYQPQPIPSDFRPSVAPELDEVVQWATHPDPLQRFATVDELLAALEEVAPDRPVTTGRRAHPPRRRAPPPPPVRHTERMQAPQVGPAPGPGEQYVYPEDRHDEFEYPEGYDPDAGYDEYGEAYEAAPDGEEAAAPPAPEPPPEPEVDPLQRVLVTLRRTLPLIAGGVSLQIDAHEVKFVYFSAQEDISGTVALSYRVEDREGRFGHVEQRVTLDLAAAQGKPSGEANLLLAANAINLYGDGLACQFGDDRLRLRRSVLLGPTAPLEPDDLQRHLDLLLRVWPQVFAALRDVQDGAPWNEALAFLLRPPVPDYERLETLKAMLEREGYAISELEEGEQIGIGTGDDQVEIACYQEQILGTFLVRPWQAPKSETRALKKNKHARQTEAILAELNRKNLESFCTLAWDPKRGVIATAPLAEVAFVPERLDLFLGLLRSAKDEVFESLGEGEGQAQRRKTWMFWRK